jgi:hypothetical protein
MGKQAKIKKSNRAKKAISRLIDEALETGKLTENENGNFQFNDPDTAEKFYTTVLSDPELFEEFIQDNPTFLEYLERAIELSENKVILELPQK